MESHNVAAAPHLTVDWLTSVPTVAIPVYQREYRWSEESCHQLLTDVRRLASSEPGRTHFIGTILAVRDGAGGVTLVDGQQRVTTVMLMLAAIRALASESEPAIAAEVARTTLLSDGSGSRLRPHERYVDVLDALILMGARPTGRSNFEENYRFFLDQVADDWRLVWDGLRRLEHVTIELGPLANAQQIFESLNSTGAALSDDELIHNYVHMGRTLAHQETLERNVWVPIEEAAGDATRAFWRDYLVLTAESQPDFAGEYGVYRAFRRRFPDPRVELTDDVGEEWVRQAVRYGVLLRPEREPDSDVREQLALMKWFGEAPRPLLLGVYGDYLDGVIDKPTLIITLEQLQTMFIRRAQVNLDREIGTIGSLCRELRSSGYPMSGLVRRTPEDPQIRLQLTHSRPANAGYILYRLQEPGVAEDLQIEHIYPQTPRADWSGDDGHRWGDLSTEEQAEYRVLLNTIGNLTLFEAALNAGAGNRSFADKATFYAQSRVIETKALAEADSWGPNDITVRTKQLIEKFLVKWPRMSSVPMDEPDDLIRVVDLPLMATGHADPDVFEYVMFRGVVWGNVHNVKTLFHRLVTELFLLDFDRLRAAENGEMVTQEKTPNKRYANLPDGWFLYTGWATKWLLEAAQGFIIAFGFDDEIKVKPLEPAVAPVVETVTTAPDH